MTPELIDKHLMPLTGQIEHDLIRMVDSNSFTSNPRGLVDTGNLIRKIAAENGISLEKVFVKDGKKKTFHLISDIREENGFLGIIGHFDTVHPPDSPFRRFIAAENRWKGPGIQDMKAGIITAIYGLRLARQILNRHVLPVKIIFNCDEETGSRDSRRLIDIMMAGGRAAFIFEGRSAADRALITRRKGIMMGEMTVTGRPAHAGEAPQEGASAIVEAAHQIIGLNNLTDLDAGVVVTTGRMSGGTVANQIADHCTATIDIRFRTTVQETILRQSVQNILNTSTVPGCTTCFSLETVRPPFIRDIGTQSLMQLYAGAASEIGMFVTEKEAGGGSDGNLTSALGVPTLDGLGAVGDFPHTNEEYIEKTSLFDAIRVFTRVLTMMLNP